LTTVPKLDQSDDRVMVEAAPPMEPSRLSIISPKPIAATSKFSAAIICLPLVLNHTEQIKGWSELSLASLPSLRSLSASLQLSAHLDKANPEKHFIG
jgi:hypothetical protein